jgi:uncharacterized protein with ATP-grasp and redox domains
MRIYLDCYPCFLRQTLEAARRAGADETRQYNILHEVLNELRSFALNSTAPEMAYLIHKIVRRETGNHDPYLKEKEASTKQALALYPGLKDLIANASDPLETAVRLSIAGNIIDLAMPHEYDLDETIERVLKQQFAINDLEILRNELNRATKILFLADNAGETVFDRLLIETIKKPVTYAVKKGPILNDATREDALAAGLGEVTTIVDNGSNAPGTIIDLCSKDFKRRLNEAELIIAKGQANYESLSDMTAPVFFLLQAKCPIIADNFGVPVKSIVLKKQ